AGAAVDVLLGDAGVDAEVFGGGGHQLHEPPGADAGHGVDAIGALDADDGEDQRFVDVVFAGGGVGEVTDGDGDVRRGHQARGVVAAVGGVLLAEGDLLKGPETVGLGLRVVASVGEDGGAVVVEPDPDLPR